MTVSSKFDLNPVHTTASSIVYYIWDISDVDLQVTDTNLSRIAEWTNSSACNLMSKEKYQNARITASAVISSGDYSFTATNIISIIADEVRCYPVFITICQICFFFSTKQLVLSNDVVELDRESYTISAKGDEIGDSNIMLDLNPGFLSTTVTVEDGTVGIHKLDPIVGTLRLSLDSVPESRLGDGLVTLQILQGVLFLQERAVVTASVVFEDGHRSLVQNPLELAVDSSNSSVVSVSEGNVLTGENEGEAVISVAWINPDCGAVILSEDVTVRVVADESRPTFVPDQLTASVPEDSSLGYTIHTVTAVVQDESGRVDETPDDIQYRFKNRFNFDGLFTLDPTSGELVLNGILDREDTESYTLMIEATNSAQRRAEQGEDEPEEEEVSMGSGSGGGDGLLTPDPSPDNTNISLNIAVLTVSANETHVHLLLL